MLGLMQDWPLLVHKIIDHAALYHGDREVVTRTVEGPIHRTNYREILRRARRRVPSALDKAGVKLRRPRRHARLEHLAPSRIAGTASRGWARSITRSIRACSPTRSPTSPITRKTGSFSSITTSLRSSARSRRGCKTVKHYRRAGRSRASEANFGHVVAYEDFIATGDEDFNWDELDENAACGLCYTSGTTGNPKGVLYSHRSNVLHAFMAARPTPWACATSDTMLPVVPMFHANAWAIAFVAPMIGAKLVMPGPKLDGASVYELLDGEKVTMTAAVPTVWLIAAAVSGGDRKDAAASETRADRRLGLPAHHDRMFREEIRRRCRACLGHDRDEPARHAGHAQGGRGRTLAGGKDRLQDETGPSALRRRDEDRRRRGQGTAARRQGLRPP